MNNFDPAIVAALFLQFGLDLARVADEEEFVDLPIFAQRQDCAADEVWRPEIATHGVQSDFHRGANLRFSAGECKTKILECGSGLCAAKGRQGRIIREAKIGAQRPLPRWAD